MAKGAGLALKGVSLFLYFILFSCAAIVLGIYSYFLAALSSNNLPIPTYIRAVEGISGSAVLYTILALLLVCCLGGITIASIIAILLNLAFCGAFLYLAFATRHGAGSCTGVVDTPLGIGDVGNGNTVQTSDDGIVYLPSYRTTCKLNTACFAVSIIGAIFFLLAVFTEYLLMRHHKKEKAFGPSPNNGYTAGSPRRKFWQRKQKKTMLETRENPDSLPAHTTPADVRHSYNTESTAVGNETGFNKYGNNATGGVTSTTQAPVVYGGPGYVENGAGYQTSTTTHVPNRGANF